MKPLFSTLTLLLLYQLSFAQLPPWNLEFYVYHPDGHTDTLWVGCDENATAGYDEGLDIIDTTFDTPIAIRGFSQQVEDEFNFGACVNLKKDIRPFGYPAEFTFYILHDSIGATEPSNSVYLGWDTSTLNYEVGDYWIEGGILFSSNGYIEGIDGDTYIFFGRDALDSTLNIYDDQAPLFIMGELFSCVNLNNVYIMKIKFEVYFKDYGVSIQDGSTISNIYIHPNPSTHQLTIESKLIKTVTAFLYDISGNLIDTILINPGIQSYNISSFPNGNYILKSFSEETKDQFTYKFIKQ